MVQAARADRRINHRKKRILEQGVHARHRALSKKRRRTKGVSKARIAASRPALARNAAHRRLRKEKKSSRTQRERRMPKGGGGGIFLTLGPPPPGPQFPAILANDLRPKASKTPAQLNTAKKSLETDTVQSNRSEECRSPGTIPPGGGGHYFEKGNVKAPVLLGRDRERAIVKKGVS